MRWFGGRRSELHLVRVQVRQPEPCHLRFLLLYYDDTRSF